MRVFCALPLDPLALNPSEHLRERFLQNRYVLCEQKESERQHPDSKHRQKAENAAGNQENGKRNPDRSRRWLAQPADESGRLWRELAFKPGQVPVDFHFVMLAQVSLLSRGRCT